MATGRKSRRNARQEAHAPGKSHREGISVTEMASMFATEAKAESSARGRDVADRGRWFCSMAGDTSTRFKWYR